MTLDCPGADIKIALLNGELYPGKLQNTGLAGKLIAQCGPVKQTLVDTYSNFAIIRLEAV